MLAWPGKVMSLVVAMVCQASDAGFKALESVLAGDLIYMVLGWIVLYELFRWTR